MSTNDIENYTRQQAIVKEILLSMIAGDAESLHAHLPILALEMFKNHPYTDLKSITLIDDVIKKWLSARMGAKAEIPSLKIRENENEDGEESD